ncbi:uncharacterized protein LOC125297675 [Alosa alosa]|uniref:uncharacterized protein LOC125297675 n=1 Tax=Alosa alosa TaxID=278164 RepID=UPI0020154769|nr:uncharacterized protein LOC125297675 [Alosa alosa]
MYAVILPKYRLSVPSMPPPSSINMEDGSQQQYVEMTYKQVCIDLERATQCITQILQSEVESNKQLKLKIDQLQNGLEEKDKLLTQANQTVTYLRNELHQRLQSTNSASQEVKGGYDGELKTEVKEEADNDGYGDSSGAELIQTVLVSSDGQRLLLPPISGDGDDMYSQSGKGSSSQPPAPPSRRKFPCPVCGKGFRFRYDLNMHHKRLHTCHKQPSASSSPAVHTGQGWRERSHRTGWRRSHRTGWRRSHRTGGESCSHRTGWRELLTQDRVEGVHTGQVERVEELLTQDRVEVEAFTQDRVEVEAFTWDRVESRGVHLGQGGESCSHRTGWK